MRNKINKRTVLLLTYREDLNHPPLQQHSSNRLLFSCELQFLPGDGIELNLEFLQNSIEITIKYLK